MIGNTRQRETGLWKTLRTGQLAFPNVVALALLAFAACPAVHADDVGTSAKNSPRTTRKIQSERNLVYRTVDEEAIKADLFRPRDEGKYPLVVMIHGGAWSAGDKWDLIDHARELAQAGFVVVSINYRLAPKVQIDAQIDDCVAAIQWATSQAEQWNADAQQLGLWGYSAGGHLASLLALRTDLDLPPISAVVAGGAVCDFEFIPEDNRVIAHVMGGSRAEVPEVYQRVTPMEFASKSAPPFFLFHGATDFLVPTESSVRLHDRLRELGRESTHLVVEGKGHLWTFLDIDARRQAVEFLSKHLTSESP